MGLTKCRERLNERTLTFESQKEEENNFKQPFLVSVVVVVAKVWNKEKKGQSPSVSFDGPLVHFELFSRSTFSPGLLACSHIPPGENVSRLDSPNTFKSGCHSLFFL